jgi:hypothetical protein
MICNVLLMNQRLNKMFNFRSYLKYIDLRSLFLSLLAVVTLFLLNGHYGYNMWDEGYQWDGVQRVMSGEIPIRDFMAYDPGRYYLSAWLMRLWGDNGLVSFRLTIAIIQFITIYFALILVVNNSARQNLLFMTLATLTLLVWCRGYDQLSPIILLASLTYLVKKPCVYRYFLAGIWVGFAAFIGRNHGVYGLVGSLATMMYLAIRQEHSVSLVKSLLILTAGIIIGYLPILLMIAFVPNFFSAFWDSITVLFELKATNLPLNIPWPWTFSYNLQLTSAALRGPIIGLFMIGLVIYILAGIFWIFVLRVTNKPKSPVLVASVFTVLPYTHYVFSRADLPHLANSVAPFIVVCLLLITMQSTKIKWWLLFFVFSVSIFEYLPSYPRWQCLGSGGQKCVETDIGNDKIMVTPRVANDLFFVKRLMEKHAPNGQNFLVVPFWPGVYPALDRKNPMLELYALVPQNNAFQQAEIERIKAAKIGFVLIVDIMLDDRPDMLYQNTHPLIYEYIKNNFQRLNKPQDYNTYDYQLYKSKQTIDIIGNIN